MGKCLRAHFNKYIRYIRTKTPQSAYAMHILNNGHEYGPINYAMVQQYTCERGTRLNRWEYYIQEYQEKWQLVEEQCAHEVNVIYVPMRSM